MKSGSADESTPLAAQVEKPAISLTLWLTLLQILLVGVTSAVMRALIAAMSNWIKPGNHGARRPAPHASERGVRPNRAQIWI